MTKAQQAAEMRKAGRSIDWIMDHFGWSRATARRMSSYGKDYDAFKEYHRSYDRKWRAKRRAQENQV